MLSLQTMKPSLWLLPLLLSALMLSAFPRSAGAEEFGLCKELGDAALYKKYGKLPYSFLVEGKDGWIYRSRTDFKTKFSLDEDAKRGFQKLNEGFRRRGIQLVLAILPTRGMTHPATLPDSSPLMGKFTTEKAIAGYNAYLEALRGLGLTVVGVSDYSKGFYYKRDQHWDWAGAKATAAAVAETVKGLDAYKDIPHKTFVTKRTKSIMIDGTFRDPVRHICGIKLPPQSAEVFVTYNDSQALESEEALFGEEAFPSIVLLGTSNSTSPEPSHANFEGFLKEALQADIHNAAISGGGIDSPLFAYLASKELEEHPPKIVIWEIPGYYSFGQEELFRQAIPAVYGDCGPRDAVFEKTIDVLPEGDQDLFTGITSSGISGEDYYLYLRFSEKVKKHVSTIVYYPADEADEDEKKDRFKFKRSKRYPYDRHFFLAFNPEIKKPATRVAINVPTEMKGMGVTARICRKPAQ